MFNRLIRKWLMPELAQAEKNCARFTAAATASAANAAAHAASAEHFANKTKAHSMHAMRILNQVERTGKEGEQ